MKDLQKLLSVFFPQTCILCGNRVDPPESGYQTCLVLCTSCEHTLTRDYTDTLFQWIHNSSYFCESCGKPLISEEHLCTQCRNKIWYFNRHFSLFSYVGHVKELIFQYKFKKKEVLAPFIARLYSECIKIMFPHHICVPVPGKPGKPFKHMEKICKILESKYSHTLAYVLHRNPGVEQKTLDFKGRTESIQGKYGVRKNIEIIYRSQEQILIIDDVFTTGSTINECAKLLRTSESIKINALTLAKD